MTKSDEQPDFAQWSEDWQSGAERDSATEEQIRHYVARRSGVITFFIVADVVVVGIALPVLLYFAVMTDSVVQRSTMLGLVAVTIGTIAFSWWNWRSMRRASATSVAECIAISMVRIRRLRLAWRVAWIVLAAEVALFTIWIWDRLYARPVPAPDGAVWFSWVWLTGFALAFAIWLVWYGRWLQRDAERFEALRRDLE